MLRWQLTSSELCRPQFVAEQLPEKPEVMEERNNVNNSQYDVDTRTPFLWQLAGPGCRASSPESTSESCTFCVCSDLHRFHSTFTAWRNAGQFWSRQGLRWSPQSLEEGQGIWLTNLSPCTSTGGSKNTHVAHGLRLSAAPRPHSFLELKKETRWQLLFSRAGLRACVTYYRRIVLLVHCNKAQTRHTLLARLAHKLENARTTLGMETPALERWLVSLSKSHRYYLMSVLWALNPGTMGTFSHRCSILTKRHQFLLRLICNAALPAVCSANAMRQETLKIVLVYADSPISQNTQSLRSSQCWKHLSFAFVNKMQRFKILVIPSNCWGGGISGVQHSNLFRRSAKTQKRMRRTGRHSFALFWF